MSGQNTVKYYLTLPFGARTFTGNIGKSPFFENRHTFQLSTPGKNGELEWFIIKNTKGLLYPRFTTEETILREFGIFQSGGTTVLMKPPIRNFSIEHTIRGADEKDYERARLQYAYVISYEHSTAAQPPGFEEINQIFNITSRWGRPNPFTFTRVGLDRTARHIDCFIQTPDPQDKVGVPDAESVDLTLRLTADEPSLFGNVVTRGIQGSIGDDTTVVEPEVAPITFLDFIFIPSGINYSIDTFASARTGFRATIELSLAQLPAPIILFSFGLFETVSGDFSRFKYVDYPSTGWAIGPGPITLEFDSVERVFLLTDAGGTITSLDISSSPQSPWDDFLFVPGNIYKFFMEASTLITPVTTTIEFRPRWAGM